MKIRIRRETVRCKIYGAENKVTTFRTFPMARGWLLRLSDGGYGYVNLLEDAASQEMRSLLHHAGANSSVPVFKLFCEIACDQIGEEVLRPFASCKCASCVSMAFESVMTKPVEYPDVEAHPLTHHEWNGINPQQREERLRRALEASGITL